MTVSEITFRVVDALNAARLPHMLVGSLSSNYYGIPRSTDDADFVMQSSETDIDLLLHHLGPDFSAEPQMTFETNTGTQKQEIHCQGTPFSVEVFLLSKDAHDQERWQRRREVHLFGRGTFLPSPEDVVIMKLRWARGKDRDDVRGVIGVQQDKLDWPHIEMWCERHGTRDLLEEIRRTVPKI